MAQNIYSTPLTAHWDGTRWTQVAAPDPDGSYLAERCAPYRQTIWLWDVGYIVQAARWSSTITTLAPRRRLRSPARLLRPRPRARGYQARPLPVLLLPLRRQVHPVLTPMRTSLLTTLTSRTPIAPPAPVSLRLSPVGTVQVSLAFLLITTPMSGPPQALWAHEARLPSACPTQPASRTHHRGSSFRTYHQAASTTPMCTG